MGQGYRVIIMVTSAVTGLDRRCGVIGQLVKVIVMETKVSGSHDSVMYGLEEVRGRILEDADCGRMIQFLYLQELS
jgi:hypothetical protein